MPNISIAELSRLRQIESRVRETHDHAAVEPFVIDFIENVGIMLAVMPRADWPMWVETAFNHASGKHPLGAHIYTQWHKEGTMAGAKAD
jgi:hypothetical protein